MSLSNLLSHKGDIMIKTSISHNYRFPTLNDLYFLPGGNSSLKTSTVSVMMRAWVSMSTRRTSTNWMAVPRGSIPKSRIGSSGYRQPRAFSHHETWKGTCLWCRGKSQSCRTAGKNWLIDLNGSYSWTPSINEGEKMSCRPVGKKTIAIRPEILPITDRTPFMGYMGISLQVGVLLGVFHHVEQRLHTDWRSTPVFHE